MAAALPFSILSKVGATTYVVAAVHFNDNSRAPTWSKELEINVPIKRI